MSTPKKTATIAAPAVTPTATPPSPPGPLITSTANGSNHATKVDLQALYQAVVSGLLAFYALWHRIRSS